MLVLYTSDLLNLQYPNIWLSFTNKVFFYQRPWATTVYSRELKKMMHKYSVTSSVFHGEQPQIPLNIEALQNTHVGMIVHIVADSANVTFCKLSMGVVFLSANGSFITKPKHWRLATTNPKTTKMQETNQHHRYNLSTAGKQSKPFCSGISQVSVVLFCSVI